MKNTQQEQLKKAAAEAALSYVPYDAIIGVGTGSTVHYFISALATLKGRIKGAVASSTATAEKLKAIGIPVVDLNTVDNLPLYVDSADAFNDAGYLIKGGGGAMTREKIIATAAKQFVCIVDNSKKSPLLDNCPVPIEVIPMARGLVARALVQLGAVPEYRAGFTTDNGNIILDAYQLKLEDPLRVEAQLNNITGVVDNGIFAKRFADECIIATPQGILIQKNTLYTLLE